MKYKLFSVLIALVLVGTLGFAVSISVDLKLADLEDYDLVPDSINDLAENFKLEKLTQSFANATAFAGNSSTFEGYQGYKLFAVSGGGMAAAQLPTSDLDALMNLEFFEDSTDVALGIGFAAPVFNVGINAGNVLKPFGLGDVLKNIYFNVKFGGFNTDIDVDENTLHLETTTAGFGVNYQLLPSLKLPLGIFTWRGVNVGTGLTMQINKIDVTSSMQAIKETVTLDNETETTGTLEINPKITIGTESTVYIMPLEASTAIQILFLNVSAGLGVDMVFGSSKISASAYDEDVSFKVEGAGGAINETKSGSIKLTASEASVPQFFQPRAMLGLGLNLGPVKLDVPFYAYFGDGYAFGLTLGFVW